MTPQDPGLPLFARILACWMQDRDSHTGAPRGALASVIDRFAAPAPQALSARIAKTNEPLNLPKDHGWWIVGAHIDDRGTNLFPVAGVAVSPSTHYGRWWATVRVGLLYMGTTGELASCGYRFEAPEPPDRPHPYPHVQSAHGWTPGLACLHHPHRGLDVEDCEVAATRPSSSEFRPAVPLPCQTLPGLGIVVLQALYGAQRAKAIVSADQTVMSATGAEGEDIRKLLGA